MRSRPRRRAVPRGPLSFCPRCARKTLSPLADHQRSPGCVETFHGREMRRAGKERIGASWGRALHALGVPGLVAWAPPDRQRHFGRDFLRRGAGDPYPEPVARPTQWWAPAEYARVVNDVDLTTEMRHGIVALMARGDERLRAVAAALKLDPTGRGAAHLLRAIRDQQT